MDCIVACVYLSSPSKVWNRAVVSQCEVVAVIEKTIVSYSTWALYIVWPGSNSGVSWTEAGVIEISDSNGKSYWTTMKVLALLLIVNWTFITEDQNNIEIFNISEKSYWITKEALCYIYLRYNNWKSKQIICQK